MTLQKANNIFEFFKSNLVINLAVCVVPILFLGLFAFKYTFLTVGFAASIAVKEFNSKNEYLFYYNNAISKTELWLYAWCCTFVSLIVLSFALNFIATLF
ncbi:hypothetical protein CXF59_11615 [Flavobacterium sp. ALD4]|uniref:hypothetical protein n=1 Tax=Flavobacterium sp. ALD4 TaxID=2058314 RepID=UPI000C322E58|nr:hypothetical protein [Flavobacterium sp. ALD4]PKH66578.1 hypothetical protein CXF59_11615 [Flavobacterium sp. ALD4]